MRAIIKRIINQGLSPLNLKVIRTHNLSYFGINLFNDLTQVIAVDDPVCLDVGANVGQTIEELTKVFCNPYIHSFEPSSSSFEKLKSKQEKFGDRIFLYNIALGKMDRKREFINYKTSTLSSFLALDADQENRFREVDEVRREIVGVETVDGFLNSHNINNVDLLKIDTQGFDLEVLLGAREALRKGVIKNVLIELNFVRMYDGQSSPEEIINLLNEYDLLLIDYYEKIRQNKTLAWCTALFGRR